MDQPEDVIRLKKSDAEEAVKHLQHHWDRCGGTGAYAYRPLTALKRALNLPTPEDDPWGEETKNGNRNPVPLV